MDLEAEKSIKFADTLTDETRSNLAQLLDRTNPEGNRLVRMIVTMDPSQKTNPDIVGVVGGMIDAHKGGMRDQLLETKLDMVDFIQNQVSVQQGSPEDVQSKQWQYKQAMESLFRTIGAMGPQEEYQEISRILASARLVKTPEDRARYELMEGRKAELEEKYGIVK